MLLLLLLLLLLLTSLGLLQQCSQGATEAAHIGWGRMVMPMMLRVQMPIQVGPTMAQAMWETPMLRVMWVVGVGAQLVMERPPMVVVRWAPMGDPKHPLVMGREGLMLLLRPAGAPLCSIQIHAHFRVGPMHAGTVVLEASCGERGGRPQVQMGGQEGLQAGIVHD